jgi:formylglycine-generating enzyme required for sulfatase activity
VASGDFNGDGKADLIFQHADGTLAIWRMSRTSLESASLLDPSNSGDRNWRVAAAGDLSRDGKPDLVFQHTDGTLAAWYMDGIKLGSTALFNPKNPGDSRWRVAGLGHFNADGRLDLVFQHDDGTLGVWFLDGVTLTQSAVFSPPNPGSSWRLASTVDRNGDGKPDLLFQHTNLDLAVWFMDGIELSSGGFLTPRNPGGTWKVVGSWTLPPGGAPFATPPSMVWIPPGTFTMGSPTTEKARGSDEPEHTVKLTKGYFIGKYEVTQKEYQTVMGYNPSSFVGDLSRPVEQVTWNDAMDYCAKLANKEWSAGRLPTGWVYRLPTEAEWEYACRAGTSTPFHYGSDLRSGMANFNGFGEYVGGTGLVNNPNGIRLARTTAVGSYQPNAFGLYDMHGNVAEWCWDSYESKPSGSGAIGVTDPGGPNSGSDRVIRGGWYSSTAEQSRSAFRGSNGFPMYNSYKGLGFRVVLAPSPLPNGTPFHAPLNLVWIPPGTFPMGSPGSERERYHDEAGHRVTLTRGFYMAKYEVTQSEYLAIMGNNPSYFNGLRRDPILGQVDYGTDWFRPVEQVNQYDAMEYCTKVTASEKAAGRLPPGWRYRLPTEAEWEYACRAGTQTPFHYGNDLLSGMANFDGRFEYRGGIGTVTNPNGIFLARTTQVGRYLPNAFGLYDMHGNVWEWCLDWYGDYPGGSVTDPTGPASARVVDWRVIRGGSWFDFAKYCRSATRYPPSIARDPNVGFRPVLAVDQP